MYVSKPIFFSLEEFLTSSTARQKSIENLPSWYVIEHLIQLGLFLDDLRSEWGSGIKVTSGYRCDKLNSAVGGVLNSVHRLGWAADVVPANGKFDEFVAFIKEWAKNEKFDQIIIESNKKSKWIHIGLYSPTGLQRKMLFNITK